MNPRLPVLATLTVVLLGAGTTAASAALPGADAQLTRAPYLTDLTASSVQVTWGTSTQSRGIVRYGPPGDCAANSVQPAGTGTPITVGPVTEYQNNALLAGLPPGTTYCYRVYTAAGTDLLGGAATPRFTTLEAAGSGQPFSFAVFGDWGDTTDAGVNDGTLNANQAGVMAQIAASGARFAISTGDVAYPSGTQQNYGDLNQTGPDVSAVFGPSYWAVPGQSVPLHAVTGNHGRNANFLSTWPQDVSVAASAGTYTMVPYPSFDGIAAASYPTSFYAFSTGGVRFYLLDAAWSDHAVGTTTGGACGDHCKQYEAEYDAHWRPGAPAGEYAWLARDLAAHPGGLKVAAFHYPLRSDDQAEPGDAYLRYTPGGTGSLEQLLHDNGVQLVFNGHAHVYQRNVAPPGGVISYVTGGGGAKSTTVSSCASTDAYAIGWSETRQTGSRCGAAPVPDSGSRVYHFLKVTVSGSIVTVTPTDAQGRTFDQQTYDFGTDTTPPTAPGALTATLSGTTRVKLAWSPASDGTGVHAYDIYRNGAYLATTSATVTGYTDSTIVAGTGYDYRVAARDLAGNTTSATASVNGGGASDTTPPSTPGAFAATATGPTSAALSWSPSTDDTGVAGYTILRGGTAVASVPAGSTSYVDSTLTPGTGYSYQVVAKDLSGNASPPTAPATVTTPADTSPPTAPGTPTATTVTASQVGLGWALSTDDVGVVRYDILRNGAVIGTATGNTFTDTTVSPGTAYTYAVRAYDAAGNSATGGTLTVTTQVGGSVFVDGFESGDLAQWTPVTGLAAQTSIVHTGQYAARETSTGTPTYAYRTLPASYAELWAQAWVYVAGRSTSANLFGFRTGTGASLVNVYLDANGRVSVRNNIGGVTTYGTVTVAPGGWHRVVLHARVNGADSSVDVTLDGQGTGISLTGQNLGTNPIARLQLGETATGRSYDIALDDVAASPSPL
ncbi:MAG TPA: fibronectin type III domain-containing protein [Rugosimonospora sp.]|nr:fibronectin type III domain-containing protein [Rugosimonospora sp.]